MVIGGIILLTIAGIGYVYAGATTTGLTIPQVVDLCNTGMGQLGQAFSGDAMKICREYGMLNNGIYGFGIIGLILIIVGAVVPEKKQEKIYDVETGRTEERSMEKDDYLNILKKRYANGEITKAKFDEAMEKEKLEEKDESPLDILKQRYSRLEITRDEFEAMKKDLENS